MRPTGPRLSSIHSRTTGSAIFQMSSFGSKRARRPRPPPGLLQQDQLRAGPHVEQAGDLEQQTSAASPSRFLRRSVVNRSPIARMACAKFSTGVVSGHVAGLEMHLGDPAIIARDEAQQNFGQEAALLHAEPAHDAEIDRDQAAGIVEEQIAGCMSA